MITTYSHHRTQPQNGFSIVELMISSALGIFLIAGTLTLYSSNKDSYRVQQAISGSLKEVRFIIGRLERNISSAGYSGFYSSYRDGIENTLNDASTNDLWNIAVPVLGYNDVNSASVIAGITGFTDGSDVLILKRMALESNLLTQTSTSSFTIGATSGYNDGDILIVTDLDKASMFQINDADNTSVVGETTVTLAVSTDPLPGNAALPANSFDNSASIGKLETLIYFLKANDDGGTSLFEGRLKTSADQAAVTTIIEIVPNVDGLQFIYGIDTDGNDPQNSSIDKYINASTVTTAEWGQVHTIGVSLLLHSEEKNIITENTSYSFDTDSFTYMKDSTPASDANKHLKQVFTTYIKLRNL